MFGGSSGQQTFGGAMNQVSNAPFGSNFMQQQQQQRGSPFAVGQSAQQPSTPFGSGGQGGSVFGQGGSSAGDNRPPCKYYAKGQCKYGTSCNFSHETPTPFGSTMTSPFGAPRR
jgi:hypothetical protein